MKNVDNKFQRLISLYIDGEATPEETQELFDCIKNNPKARMYFLRACAIDKAMRKLYGKDTKFARLASFDVEKALVDKKPTKLKVASEWISVAVLMAICACSMYFALLSKEKVPANNSSVKHNYEAEITQNVQIGDAEVAIIKVYPTPPYSE